MSAKSITPPVFIIFPTKHGQFQQVLKYTQKESFRCLAPSLVTAMGFSVTQNMGLLPSGERKPGLQIQIHGQLEKQFKSLYFRKAKNAPT